MLGKDRLRPTGQAELSPYAKYDRSKKAYFAALNDPTSDPRLLDQRFSSLSRAYYSVDGISFASKTWSLTTFGRTGMVEARKKGHADIADSLGKQVQRLEDNLAIAENRYAYLGSRVSGHDDVADRQTSNFLYRAPDGRLVERSGDEHDDILILKAGHSPNGYTFTRTGLVLPVRLEPFTRPVKPHADAEAAAALLFD